MSFPISISVLCLTLFMALFTIPDGICHDAAQNITNYLVTFDPPVAISNEGGTSACMGIIRSADRIVLTSACATAARQLRQGGALSVLDKQGRNIGQLPVISGEPMAVAVRSLAESGRQVPFISEREPDSTFPTILDVGKPGSDGFMEATYYLINPDTAGDEEGSQPVRLKKLSPDKEGFNFSGLAPDILKQYPVGSPVVNDQGKVLCLLTDGENCENVSGKNSGANDGSCKVFFFRCTHVSWDECSVGTGQGQCTNKKSNERCAVFVVPDNTDIIYGSLHCKNSHGCGAIGCPSTCSGNDCDCSAVWGFSELPGGNITEPDRCIPYSDFRNSQGFWPVVIGVPVVAVASTIAVVALVAVVIYKRRHRGGYSEINN